MAFDLQKIIGMAAAEAVYIKMPLSSKAQRVELRAEPPSRRSIKRAEHGRLEEKCGSM